jgi:LruC domain-containing protein/uncharacterized repeat protein (TIGR01451 family)
MKYQEKIKADGFTSVKAQLLKIALLALFTLALNIGLVAQSFILDLQGETMSFTNAQRTIVNNTGNNGENTGSIHRYDNVITKDGITVYALMKIAQKQNAFFTNFDDDAITGEQTRFQPRIGSGSGGGFIVFELEFFNAADDASVFVYNYNLTAVDIDGNGNNREYVEVGGYTSYQVNSNTGLTVSTNSNSGRTKFLGIGNSLSGVTFENTAAFITNFSNANNKISFALGQSSSNSERFYSVQIGVAGGVFSDPIIVNNPLPIAVDDVGTPINSADGGVAVPNVLDNDLYDGDPVIPSAVTISTITDFSDSGIELNESTGEVTVAPGTPGGTYTAVYQICMNNSPNDCDVATITVQVLQADLEITKVASAETITAGQSIEYTLTVTNNGPTKALDAVVTDNIPAALTITNVNPSKGSWTAPEWSIGDMANGDTETLVITATIDGTFTGDLENTATVSSPTSDPNMDNNTSTVNVTVNEPAGPTANDDEASTEVNTPVDITILANDTAGDAPIDPTTVTFIAGTEPDATTEGVFTVDTDGIVTFTPVNDFIGTVTIDYQVCDENNFCDIATITVDVLAGIFNNYPATGFGTLGFEDLWPSKGDYDFNDLVIDYKFEIITNFANKLESVTATFVIKAFGASYENGFGFQLSEAIDPADLTVTGYDLTEDYITLDANGTEAGQSKPTIIVYDNAYGQMEHPGMGIGVNTEPSAPYVQPKTLVIEINFPSGKYAFNDLDIANFNPFLIVNKDRAVEVHLPNYLPTDLANTSLLGTYEDSSNPGENRYYKTEGNLPWAINIYETFEYPIEKQEVLWAHLKFAEWATSGGILFPDWYKNLSGYRNNALIYTAP